MESSMPRVLIVEDHASTRRVLRSFFVRRGWQVKVAGTLAEGMASLKPPPDCLVLDLMLPDGPGEEILRKVRAEGIRIGVVVVTTGLSDPARLGEVAKLGPVILIQKPIDLEVVGRLCDSEVRAHPGWMMRASGTLDLGR